MMITKNRLLTIIGVLIILIPFLGFPNPFESFLIIAVGVSVIAIAFAYARHKRMPKNYTADVFVENNPSNNVSSRVTSELENESGETPELTER